MIRYCDKWNTLEKKPWHEWTEEQAHEAHKKGEAYTTLIYDHKKLKNTFMVGINNLGYGFAHVGFIDRYDREHFYYSFKSEESRGMLFMSFAVFRKFVGKTDQVQEGETYSFKENGDTIIMTETFVPKHKLMRSEAKVNVSDNYEDYPGFGEYDAFLRKERDIKSID